MSNKSWVSTGLDFYHKEIPSVSDSLKPAIYELDFDSFQKCFFLKKISDIFNLPEKMYGLENVFVDRVVTTFNKLDKNFGVLLKGMKGTGKTHLSKLICNKINQPVILINKSYTNIGEFINSINQDLILLFDEFEKTYNVNTYISDDDDDEGNSKNINSLLTLMDGVFTSEYKRLFLLTTNKVFLPDALLSRPSRIRYIKEFSDLKTDQILEIIEDTLSDKKHREKLINFLSSLEFITVDVVKSICEEINLYGFIDDSLLEEFNVTKMKQSYSIIEVLKDGKETEIVNDTKIPITSYYEGSYVRVNNINLGRADTINYEDEIIITKNNKGEERTFVFKPVLGKHLSVSSLVF